jgi:hypothetical protein
VTRQALAHGIAQSDQQWSDRDNPKRGRSEPKAPHMERGHCRSDKAEDNHRGACGDSTSNCGGCEEPQHAPHIFQLEPAPEPVLNQPSREEGLARIKEAEGDGEPDIPSNRESARSGRDENSNGHWQACPATQGDQRAN